MDGGGDEDSAVADLSRVRPSVAERHLLTGTQEAQQGSDLSTMEALQLGSGRTVKDLRRDAEEQDHNRSQKFRNHFECAMIFAMWLVVLGYLAMAAVWATNLCLPEAYRGLSPEELSDLGSVLTGGLLIGLLSKHLEKRTA